MAIDSRWPMLIGASPVREASLYDIAMSPSLIPGDLVIGSGRFASCRTSTSDRLNQQRKSARGAVRHNTLSIASHLAGQGTKIFSGNLPPPVTAGACQSTPTSAHVHSGRKPRDRHIRD